MSRDAYRAEIFWADEQKMMQGLFLTKESAQHWVDEVLKEYPKNEETEITIVKWYY